MVKAAKPKKEKKKTRGKRGLIVPRIFTKKIEKVDDFFELKPRKIEIRDSNEDIIYKNDNVFFPESWSELSGKVVASKYLYKGDDKEHIENKVSQLVHRVTKTISKKAVSQGIISGRNSKTFQNELFFNVMNQGHSFNSPVWFNVGLWEEYGVKEKEITGSHWAINKRGRFTNRIDAYKRPQGAACFIQSIKDSMNDIMDHAKREAMLFKFGSGTGTNFSNLRAIGEPLSGGGKASGQLSFFRIYDIIAGCIMSGGKTRRAAKMVIQDDNHPDLLRFIQWKAREEQKALWLCAQPRWSPRSDADLESEAYKTITGQNGNNTIRVTDEFMNAALTGADWNLWYRTASRFTKEKDICLDDYVDDRQLPDKRFIKRLTNKRKIVNAGEVFEQITRAAAVSGDPAIQYHDNINRWNTCPNTGIIRASNPCSEFMAPDDSACNLASLNLIKYVRKREEKSQLTLAAKSKGSDGVAAIGSISDSLIDFGLFKQGVRNSIIAQEALVDYCSYPAKDIARNAHNLRPLGLGYTNLAALLMEQGIAYDSDEGRALAGAVTSLMTAYAYQTSAELAQKIGAFEDFKKNKGPMLNVLKMHYDEAKKIKRLKHVFGLEGILDETEKVWTDVLKKGERYGFRNSQVTLLAPTGTIGFMMDVDVTGIEPMPAIAYTKALAGGGELNVDVKPCVKKGLEKLGYHGKSLEKILDYIKENETIMGAPEVDKKHYNVFATALERDNIIPVDGHLNMMAAVQPHLSGAISKTVNLPKGSTIQDVKNTYVKGWRLGLKSISLYVDGSKGIQPINVKSKAEGDGFEWGDRDKPKNSMHPGGFIHRAGWNVDIGKTGVNITIGEYDNRIPGNSIAEIFVSFGKAGAATGGTYELWSKEASRNLQSGPKKFDEFIKHNLGSTGPTNGLTNHPYIKTCSSIPDFISKLILLEYRGDKTFCDEEVKPDYVRELRCNVLANQRRARHYQSRIDYIDKALNEGELIKTFPLLIDKVESDLPSSQIYCNSCGFETKFSGANCRKCYNCGDSDGCG